MSQIGRGLTRGPNNIISLWEVHPSVIPKEVPIIRRFGGGRQLKVGGYSSQPQDHEYLRLEQHRISPKICAPLFIPPRLSQDRLLSGVMWNQSHFLAFLKMRGRPTLQWRAAFSPLWSPGVQAPVCPDPQDSWTGSGETPVERHLCSACSRRASPRSLLLPTICMPETQLKNEWDPGLQEGSLRRKGIEITQLIGA